MAWCTRSTFNRRSLLACVLLTASLCAAANPALKGAWSGTVAGDAFAVVFDGKGGGTANGRPIRYQTQGNVLFVEDAGDVAAYTFDIQGSKLVVAGGAFDQPVTLTRGTASATAAAKRSPPSGGSVAGIQAAMVGKWCKVSSFTANAGGGSQSSACFELRGDGSYSYGAESSMSAQAPGMWGGTASSSGDAGRWSATERTLTAHSQSGQVNTYQLEKRNHPRNRDPMLCLDGECYVSYWQKAPW